MAAAAVLPSNVDTVLAGCLAGFEAQVQQRVQKMIDEEVRALKEAFTSALQKAGDGKVSEPTAAKLASSPGSRRGSGDKSKQEETTSSKGLQPSVSTDFKREITTVFKKKQNAGEARVSLTRQSIQNGGDEVRKSLQRLTGQDPTEPAGENPVPPFFKGKNGKPACDMKKFTAALVAGEIPTQFLDQDIGTDMELPPPLFFGVGQKNEKLVKLLIDHRADCRLRYKAEKQWNGVRKGMTALEAASNMKGRFIGTILETKFQMIEEILRAEEDRLRGWKGGVVVTKKKAESDMKTRTTLRQSASKGLCDDGPLIPDGVDLEKKKDDQEEEDSDEEITEEQERELEEKSRAYLANGGNQDRNNKRKSLLVYVSKAAFICEHIEGDPSEMYELGDKVGEGTFGFVRKAVHKLTKVPRAIKTVPKMLLEDSGLWQEIEIMRELDHPHIMKIFSTYEDCENLYIIVELCTGGDLIDVLSKAGHFSERAAGGLFKQMTGAVCYLHSQGICHRDLKPENFLLSMPEDLTRVHVKLIDFGAARHFGPDKSMTTKICALHYVAPEIVSKKEVQYSEKCDVWSLGVILYLMLCGAPPFWGDDDMSVLKDIKKGRYTFEPKDKWDAISKPPVDLIQKMLVVDPEKRLAITEVAAGEKVWLKEIGAEQIATVSAALINNMRAFRAQTKLKKIALQVFAQQMSDEAVADLRSVFDGLDEGSVGSLKKGKFIEGLMSAGVENITRDEAEEIISELSQHHKDGDINYSQFLAACIDRHQYLKSTDAIRASFNVFDMNSTGAFGEYEMNVLLSNNEAFAADLESGRLDIFDLIEEADLNDDGKIDFDEFLEMMRSEPGQ